MDRNEFPFPFLTNTQVEELNEFGYTELTEELIESMASYYGVEVVD